MKSTTITLAVISLILLIVAFFTGGMDLVTEGLIASSVTAYRALLLIFAAFLVIGQLQTLITADMIKNWMQKYSGSKGILLSSLAGGLFPGGPYIFYPFLAGFKGKGIPFYLLFTFVSGKQVYDFTRLPLEISLINPEIAFLRYILTFPVPFLMGLISKLFFPCGVKGVKWKTGGQ